MPCNYNPATGEVETLYERYQRETQLEEIMFWQSIDEKIDGLEDEIAVESNKLKECR